MVWERPLNKGIASFNIYRQSASTGVYDLLGNVPFENLSVFVDSTSQPEKKQHWYKISAVDTCGNESSLSHYHRTLLLQFDAVDGDLIWPLYEIEGGNPGFTSYIIYRGIDSLQLDSIDVVAGNATVYTDDDPASATGLRWYRIAGVMPSVCSPGIITGGKKAGTGPYHHSLSNLDNNKLQGTGFENVGDRNRLNVYPNPFQEKVNIVYQLREESSVQIDVINLLGVRILQLENQDQLPGTYKYEIQGSDLGPNTICYLRFTVDGYTTVKKLIPAR